MQPPSDPEPLTTLHVRRAADGDVESLNWIVSRLTPLLVAQAKFRIGPALRRQVDAEDLVHEAWAVALPRMPELTPRDGRLTPVLLRFLATTMTHRIKKLLQRRVTQSQVSVDGSDWAGELPASTSGVITQAFRHEQQDLVREQIDELEEIDRNVLILRGIEQHPAKTVAVMLDISPAAVDQRYSRAMRRLRSRIPDSVFEELEAG